MPKGKTLKEQLWVQGSTLHINNALDVQPIRLTLTMPHLEGLRLNGPVYVRGDHIHSHELSIHDNSTRAVHLKGMMNVAYVGAHSQGDIRLEWVKGDIIKVNGDGSGSIFIAGVAKELRAKINATTHLNAQYLRATNVMVRTRDEASAKVFPVDAVEAFAYGFSNVYLYHAPISLNRMTKQSGNIFQVDYRP